MADMQQASAAWLDGMKARCAQNADHAKALPPTAQEERSARIEAVRVRSEVPEKFRMSILQNFTVAESNTQAHEAAKAFVARDFRAPGLGLYGDVGIGKTRLMSAIANAAIMAERRAVVLTTTDLVLRLRATFSTSDESEYSLIQRLVHTPVLIVDDLGKEQITEWSAQNVFEFFNARYNLGLPLVCASNSSLQDLQREKYSSAPQGVDPNLMLSVLDRIREMTGPWVRIDGKSRRRSA